VGDVPIVICALTVAELAHGIYRADSVEKAQRRRRILDELKVHIPIHPVTETTAEIIGRIGGEQASNGVNLPLADLIGGTVFVRPKLLMPRRSKAPRKLVVFTSHVHQEACANALALEVTSPTGNQSSIDNRYRVPI
jgi:hypothetical protein